MAKILIIDDDPSVRDYLVAVISRKGHEPVQAATGQAGLAQLDDPTVQAVVADVFLPDSPTLAEWMAQLKAHAAGRPLILITGEPSEELARQVQRGEITAFLSKPFELAFIHKLLERALAEPAPRPAHPPNAKGSP
ncbi:MAG: response regulator [Opitutae bacterium]|nr:response regulator [Opitutae bacterium]